VNITDCPLADGFTDEASMVVVAVLAFGFTTCVSTDEVEPAKVELPPYEAVIECVPRASAEVVSVACQAVFRVPVPKVVVPSRKVIVPVGGVVFPDGPDTVAVNVTD